MSATRAARRLSALTLALVVVGCTPPNATEPAMQQEDADALSTQPEAVFTSDRNTSPDVLSALEIVAKTIESNGGETWRRPRTLQLSGSATMTFEGRTDQLDRLETYRMWRVFPTESTAARTANGMVRFDAARADFSAEEPELDDLFFRVTFNGSGSIRHYHPDAERYQEISGWTNSFGFGILRFADGEGFDLVRLANDQVEGHDCFFVRVKDPSGHETDFAIDQESYAVRQVAFDTPAGFHHRIYSDFEMAPGVSFRQPTRVRIYFDGVKWIDIDWSEFKINEPIDASVFSPAS